MSTEDTMNSEPSSSARWLSFLCTIFFGTAARATALYFCWKWFIVPLGVPQLGGWHLLGLTTLGQVLLPPRDIDLDRKSTNRTLLLRAGLSIVFPLLTLCLGWVYHSFML